MSNNGVTARCACLKHGCEPQEDSNLILLSTIPNQKVYRCSQCHSFLSYTDDRKAWEVLLQGDIEQEIKNLYEYQPTGTGIA